MLKITSLIPAVVLVAIFALPDIYLWSTVDKLDSPVRYYRGDTYHYLSVFHSAMVDTRPNANSHFLEQPNEPSQFFLLQGLAVLLTPFKDISIVWFDVVLRVATALLVYWLLTKLFLFQSMREGVAKILAFSITAIYGIIAFKGYALGFWFLPAILGGIYCLMKFIDSKGERRLVWPIFLALPLLAVHPVSFTMGGLAALIVWIMRLREEKSKKLLQIFILWGLLSGAIFAALFLPFLIASSAGEDSMYRVVAVDTRLPIHPVYSLQLIALVIAAFLAKERAILALAIASFVGLNSHIITGTYIANDHYFYPINDFLGLILALGILFKEKMEAKRYRVFGALLFLLSAFSLYDILRYLNFQPGYFGKWLPMFAGFFLLAIILFSVRSRDYLKTILNSKLIWAVVMVALLYAPTLSYKDMQLHIDEHRETQAYRPLIENFREKSSSVVLARPEVADVIGLYTNHKLYWSKNAFSESVTDEELKDRWMDAAIFYPDDKFIQGDEARLSVMGNANRCMVHKRDHYYKILAELGITQFQETFCDRYLSYLSGWPALKEEAGVFASRAIATGLWQPKYRIDWLILEEGEKEKLGKFLEKYFTFVEVVDGKFFVYHFTNGLP